MKTTNIMKFLYAAFIPVFLIGLFPLPLQAQDENKKEMKIKMVKEVNGEKVVVDTVINLSDNDDFNLEELLGENFLEDLHIDMGDLEELEKMDYYWANSDKGESMGEMTFIMKKDDGDNSKQMSV